MTLQETYLNGKVILIDKPLEWTSFDVIKKLRYALKIKKIGHAGTLDPLATGLLIICTGAMTKKLQGFQDLEKEYIGQLILGKTTPSVDLETDFDSEQSTEHLTQEQVLNTVNLFRGSIQQTPPIYSAIRVQGQRLYKKARRGESVEIKSREVSVSTFEITQCQLPVVDFRVVCSKGTYIRSLVRDFGNQLGVGAYLNQLRRTRIGDYQVNEAQTPQQFVEQLSTVS